MLVAMGQKGLLSVVVSGAAPAADVSTLVRQALERGWGVQVIATPSALAFFDAAEVEALTGSPVRSQHRAPGTPRSPVPDAIVVAPATFNLLNQWALGIADSYALAVLAEQTGMGLPIVVLGQNEHIAWGFTNTAPDVQDLYLEQIKSDDPAQYRTPDGWAPFETFEETIAVKGKASVTMTVRATRHGPVISDAATEATKGLTGPAAQPAYAIAMRWTALDSPSTTLDAGLVFAQASPLPARSELTTDVYA